MPNLAVFQLWSANLAPPALFTLFLFLTWRLKQPAGVVRGRLRSSTNPRRVLDRMQPAPRPEHLLQSEFCDVAVPRAWI